MIIPIYVCALLATLTAGLVCAQSTPQSSPSALMKAPKAFARLNEDQVRETAAYTLGVQAVLWGMQWVKAGETFRMVSRPLPNDAARSPFDPNPHGMNTWGHAQKLLTADFRT